MALFRFYQQGKGYIHLVSMFCANNPNNVLLMSFLVMISAVVLGAVNIFRPNFSPEVFMNTLHPLARRHCVCRKQCLIN